MTVSHFQTFVQTVGEATGVAPLAADDEGYLALRFDDIDLHLQYEDEAGEVVLFSRLGEIEADRTEEIALLLLGANLFWQGTRGATFSVEPATRRVFLADRQPLATLRVEDAVSWIERFHEIATHWRARLVEANHGGAIPELGADLVAEEPDEARDTAYAETFLRV